MPYKRGLGREHRVVTVRVPENVYSWLLRQAESSGDSIAAVVRRLIREAMQRHGVEDGAEA